MIRYTSESQLTIEGFDTPFNNSLSADNRWVMLSKVVNWDKFSTLYIKMMNADFGRPGVSPRIVLGALIIKHQEKLDDRGVIEAIQENPYMQFFIGLKAFTTKRAFDPSLFVQIRKRVGVAIFDELTVDLIQSISPKKEIEKDDQGNDLPPKNKGKLQADATVADQKIAYPTDSNVLNSSRKQCELLIDKLYELKGKSGVKPRTYRKELDKSFLNYSKKKRKPTSAHRKMNRKLLEAMKRDLSHINKMLDSFSTFPLSHKEQRMLWVVTTAYIQQKEMYDTKTKSCKHRIVCIHQPHVRPIPRGKAKSQVEFGSKLGVSLDNGFARIDTFSWEAYSEGKDLIKHIENYKIVHHCYPELVQVDKAYSTKENRDYLKAKGIRITAPALGRRPKLEKTAYQKRKHKKEAAERNHIEGKFGQGKNGYQLNQIRAKLVTTSQSWVAAIFFIMNLINFQKKVCLSLFLAEIRSVYNDSCRFLTLLENILFGKNISWIIIQEK